MSRADRLLRAAVSGYCALTRPRKFDAQQLQDLALPLLESASRDTLRYVAAALSKCETEPVALVRELARMSIDIAAPLLRNSQTLTDTDLIVLIGAHGIKHARAIAKRPNLHPSIAQLIRLIELRQPPELPEKRPVPAPPPPREPQSSTAERLERAREKLRTIMLASHPRSGKSPTDAKQSYEALRDGALKGGAARFVAALSDSLGISRTTAWIIASDASCTKLISATRAIGLTEEQVYLIASALFPLRFPNADSIARFLERYRASDISVASKRLDEWQSEAIFKAAQQV